MQDEVIARPSELLTGDDREISSASSCRWRAPFSQPKMTVMQCDLEGFIRNPLHEQSFLTTLCAGGLAKGSGRQLPVCSLARHDACQSWHDCGLEGIPSGLLAEMFAATESAECEV